MYEAYEINFLYYCNVSILIFYNKIINANKLCDIQPVVSALPPYKECLRTESGPIVRSPTVVHLQEKLGVF